jgi:hypothetical protein
MISFNERCPVMNDVLWWTISSDERCRRVKALVWWHISCGDRSRVMTDLYLSCLMKDLHELMKIISFYSFSQWKLDLNLPKSILVKLWYHKVYRIYLTNQLNNYRDNTYMYPLWKHYYLQLPWVYISYDITNRMSIE